jgi:hypothetical protein
MAHTLSRSHILTSIPTIYSTNTRTTSLSPEEMIAIDMRVSELRYAYDHDMEMSDEDCKALGYINYCQRMQVFEPFDIKQFDVIDAPKKYDIIENDRPDLANYTKEESIVLKDILSTKWNEIDFDMKVIFHALNYSLPHWGYLYPPIQSWLENAKDYINRIPYV